MIIKLIPNGWFDYKKVQATTERVLTILNVPHKQIVNLLEIIAKNCNFNNLTDVIPTIDKVNYRIIYYPRSEDDPLYGLGPVFLLNIESNQKTKSILNKIGKAKLPVICHIISNNKDKGETVVMIKFKIAYHQELSPALVH